MKKILLMTLAAIFLSGSMAFAATKTTKHSAASKTTTQKSATAQKSGDARSECQELARREMISAGAQMDDFMKQCVEKVELEKKGDVNYPAPKNPQERSGAAPAAKGK